ncbi:MAG TPA: lysophospholipid acyltransferase family protein [Gemmatimonadaceae bacterium]|nr:lysophospholipid acyltransferase family protein [Gemmatimonadaceae bacterium]
MEPSAVASRPRKHNHSRAHKAEYALARTLEKAVSTMPERASDSLGKNVGRLVHRLGIRLDVVDENLRLAFPEKGDAWVAEITRKTYEHLGREAAAMMRLSKLDPQTIVDRTLPAGWDQMEAALGEGRGVLLVTGHYGNWEVAAASVAARGVPIAAIVRRQGNRLVDERLQETRRMLGIETIYQGDAPARVPRVLRANGVVGIVGDQNARRTGILVPFFGRPASTHRGPALFALRLNAPVFSCIARRLPGRDARYEIAGERVDVTRTGDLDTDVTALTTELARRLEQQVRIAPEQYFWFHKRWKISSPR